MAWCILIQNSVPTTWGNIVQRLRPISSLAPDQTLTLYQYDQTATTLTTTVWQGDAASMRS